jgi:drug/metabolite transporter (DMT)-like permease
VTTPTSGAGGGPASLGRATLIDATSASSFCSNSVLVSVGLRSGGRLVEILAWRFVFATVLLAIVAGAWRTLWSHRRRGVPIVVLAGGGQAVIAGLCLSALHYISAGTMNFLFYTYPAWVTVIAALRGKEPLTGRRLLALAMSLAGIAVMVGTPGTGGSSTAALGVALALAAALLYAIYIPMLNHLGRELSPVVTATFTTLGASVTLAIAALATGGLALRQPGRVWLVIVLLAVVCTVFAFVIFLRGLAAIGPVRTAIVSTVEPFWTAVLATAVLGQALTVRTLIGGALVAGAVVVLNLPQRSEAAAVA